MSRVALLAPFLLIVSSVIGVVRASEFTEIVFRPIGDAAGRMDIAVYADSVQVKGGYWSYDMVGTYDKAVQEDIVDIIPLDFQGVYTVGVGMDRFFVEVDTNRKPGPLVVEFDCPDDCDATVETADALTHLPKLLKTTRRWYVVVHEFTDSKAGEGDAIVEALDALGFRVDIVRNTISGEGWGRFMQCTSEVRESADQRMARRLIVRALLHGPCPDFDPAISTFIPVVGDEASFVIYLGH